jgi:hypothetical protein
MSDPDRADRVWVCDCPEYRYRVCDVCQCVTAAIAQTYDKLASIDWPARFRAAAEVAKGKDGNWAYYALRDLQEAAPAMSPDVLEAIGRALLGERS